MTQSHADETIKVSNGFALRDDEFAALREFLYAETGISLGESKREMVYSRLSKRLRHYGKISYGDYLQLLTKEGSLGAERQEFINCLTTNKTDFFREPHHFAFLRETLIPRLREQGVRRLRVWSAGCSTGEEPYTLAMTLREQCPLAEGWDVRILASDIDTAVLAAAEKGVYEVDRLGGLSTELLHQHFLRGTGAKVGKVAVCPELRDMISFRQITIKQGRNFFSTHIIHLHHHM